MDFNLQQLDELLERYQAADTSLAEEQLLRQWLQRDDLPPEYRYWQVLFAVFEDDRQQALSESFFTEVAQRLSSDQNPARPLFSLWLLRAAAVACLLTVGYYLLPNRLDPGNEQANIDWSRYEPESPQEALRIYREAIFQVSSEINRGSAKAARQVDRVRVVGQYFD